MAISQARALVRSIRSDKIRDLTEKAIEAGFDAYYSGSGHLRLVNPENGASVWLSTTSNGAARAFKNTRAALKRAGLDLEEHTMPKGQRLTPAQIDQIRVMRDAGLRVVDIADRLGVSTKAVGDNSPAEYMPGGVKYHMVIGPIAAQKNIEAFDAQQTTQTIAESEQVDGWAENDTATTAVGVMDRPASTTGPRVAGKTPPGMKMRPEQYEMLRALLAEGGTNLAIAAKVGVSNWTVGQYRRKFAEETKPDRPTTEVSDRLVSYSEPTDEQRAAQPMNAADVAFQVTREYTLYPTIRGLVDRQRSLAQLLKLAEASRDDDVQLLVMQKMELTGLEKEAVDLWHATHGQQANGNGGHTDD